MQVLGAGGSLDGPAHTGLNFGGKTSILGAAPHDWGFAKNAKSITQPQPQKHDVALVSVIALIDEFNAHRYTRAK